MEYVPSQNCIPPKNKAGTESGLQASKTITPVVDHEMEELEKYRNEFIKIASETSLRPFNARPIRKYCQSVRWHNDLVFNCSNLMGGEGNLRSQLLHCVRHAMLAGAALILPKIPVRAQIQSKSGPVIVHKYEELIDMEYLFDKDLFYARLGESCPQLKIYNSRRAIPGPRHVVDAEWGWKQVWNTTLPEAMRRWQRYYKRWRVPPPNITMVDLAVHLNFGDICTHGAGFANTFGQLLASHPEAYRIAAAVLFELSYQYKLALDPSSLFMKDAYLGIHLRTAADAIKFHFLDFETQAQRYQELAKAADLPVIYVASGNQSSVPMFGALVAPTPVVTKYTLLRDTDELDTLRAMTWDQQGLVDTIVLIKSSMFLGMNSSSMSWNVAKTRQAMLPQGVCSGRTETPRIFENGNSLVDELSVIIGEGQRYELDIGVWPS
ncbi:hypothetical protein BP6252_06632 [Coleophoma cylindrospora]|uniref:O-fucosyltransferase family protein n=1 Tax=Coleophoma cylindrospora TaxID=1849047 RepID=A0A3D8RNF7_9HELO|nr:hypothetical protein BP6252_06632 [Coleophoma cylindrospora]